MGKSTNKYRISIMKTLRKDHLEDTREGGIKLRWISIEWVMGMKGQWKCP
jgi:hypothetical protein